MTPMQAKGLMPDTNVWSQQGNEKPVPWVVSDWPKLSGKSDDFTVQVKKSNGQTSNINLSNVKYFHITE